MESQQTTNFVNVEEHGLKKHKMKTSTVVFMIFCLVAAGCFGIEEAIPGSGPGLTIIMLCIMPFVWGLPFGLVASELGSVRPQEGGYYKWVQEALGEFWGFQSCWWRTISIYIDNVSYVILAGGYASKFWNFNTFQEFIFKLAMIAIFIFINIRGVKDVGSVSTILAILVMVAFALVAICGFTNWGGDAETASTISFQITPEACNGMSDWFLYIGSGIAVIMWMYSGYESMSTIAGEIENPQVIPRGTLITIPIIMISYILPTVAGLGSLGQWSNWAPDGDGLGYGDVLTHFWGVGFGLFFVVIAILAQCSIFNTYIASGSRGFFSLADDHLAPPVLVKCDRKHGVPYVAVLSIGVFSLICCMLPFGFIIILDMALLASSYILVFISAMILRRRIPAEEYKFKIPGGDGFMRVICIIPIALAVFAFLINGSDYYVGGMTGLLTGIVLYIVWRRRYGGLSKKYPERFPANPKTGLRYGDTRKISFLLLLMSIMNVAEFLFVPWYEGWFGGVNEWGAGDYFDGMLSNANITTIQTALQTSLSILTVICGVGCIVFFLISKKVEAAEEQ